MATGSGIAALVCLVLVAVVGFLPDDPESVRVVAGTVVRPWAVGTWLLVVALVLAFVRGLAIPLPAPTEGETVEYRHRSTWPRRIVVGVLAAGAVAGVGRATLVDASSQYFVLDPPSPTGCRVVVEERFVFMAVDGSVHVLPPGESATRRIGDYHGVDPYRPVELGTYQLAWSGETGRLQLMTSPSDIHANGVDPSTFSVRC